MTMLGNFLRFGRRKLHTIISTEIIKPSSPTPSHLKTYNLTLIDQFMGDSVFMPLLLLYPNNDYRNVHDRTLDMKYSLSQILSNYYPFAGRHAKVAPAHVDCTDDGAEFVVGSIDTTLSDFLCNSQREDLNQFFPNGQVWYDSNRESQSDKAIPLAVQVNHFECGGMAVALSLSHKVADGSSFFNFVADWAKMTRFCSRKLEHAEPPSAPQFTSYPYRNIKFKSFSRKGTQDYVTRSFMFPNSKINELRLKVKAMTVESITNPTRVDVLSWLLYKCAVEAASKNNAGIFTSTVLHLVINIRTKMLESLPEKSIGNYVLAMKIPTKRESEIEPGSLIGEVQKQKMNIRRVRNIEAAFDLLLNTYSETALQEHQKSVDESYIVSSLCRYGAYEIDFGWGKPVKITIAGNMRNSVILMDAPNGDGIEALVCLKKKDMTIFQTHPELLAFCD